MHPVPDKGVHMAIGKIILVIGLLLVVLPLVYALCLLSPSAYIEGPPSLV